MGVLHTLAGMRSEGPAAITFEVELRVAESDYEAARLILGLLDQLEGKMTYGDLERALIGNWAKECTEGGGIEAERARVLWDALFWYRLAVSSVPPDKGDE